MDRSQFIYDKVPYPSLSFRWTHPDHLATIATLLGLDPAPVERCRVLELGCASGGNLIPMAYSLPQSEFVGIDLAESHIAEGQAKVAMLGLENIDLQKMDITDIQADFGEFDYIIVHGVYSWVSEGVRDKVLEICRQNLAPHGVAYISYNTFPGWRMLGVVRDMMLFHTRHLAEPNERVAEARDLIDFLAGLTPSENSPHASFLNTYLNYINEWIVPKKDSYLLHEELEEINEPIYFYQFAERVAHHGLQYLADADFQGMLVSNLPDDVARKLGQMVRNTVELEQYMDFIRNRLFRQSLLCHPGTRLGFKLTPECLARFHVASSAQPETSEPDIHAQTVENFKSADGATLKIDHPVSKAAFMYLGEIWPRSVSFNTLLNTAQARLNGSRKANDSPNSEVDVKVLGANLLKAYGYSESLVGLHVHSPAFESNVSERPIGSPVARLQARDDVLVTNLRHERVELEDIGHRLLPHLDGSRSRTDLLDILADLAASGEIEVKQDDQIIEDRKQIRNLLDERLDAHLQQLANVALLIG